MKILFINTLNTFRNSWVWISLLLFICPLWAFKTDIQDSSISQQNQLSTFERLEAGLAEPKSMSSSVYLLAQGEYQRSLDAFSQRDQNQFPWLKEYLEGLIEVSGGLVKIESENFDFFVPADQTFLAHYSLPVLEEVRVVMGKKNESFSSGSN